MRNTGLDEAQAGIKIAGRNSDNLRYADDTTLMAEIEEELKSLLMKVKEESEKVGLKLSIQKTKFMTSGPITSWQIDEEEWKQWQTLFWGGYKITADVDCSVQSLSHVWPFEIPWNAARQASLSITNYWSLPKPMSIESGMLAKPLTLCHPLLLLPSIFTSIRVFSLESALYMRWPKYWNFSFNISPSNGQSGLICFRMDWLDLFAVQGSLKSLFQHHSSKASILWCLAFFIVQLSHPYMTTGRNIALMR